MKKLIPFFLLLISVSGAFIFFEGQNNTVDPKEAINQGISQYKKTNSLTTDEEAKVRIQLAIADYLAANTKLPEDLNMLVPKYFDRVPRDPSTGKAYVYKVDGRKFELIGGESKKSTSGDDGTLAVASEDFINPNKMEMDDFVYDPTGKRDPFRPFTVKQDILVNESAPPLLRYDISQFRVAAVLTDSKGGRFAMVEDATGIGYPVHVDDKIGLNNGKVIKIEPGQIEVLETVTNAAGESKQELRYIKLVSGGGSSDSLKNRGRSSRSKRR